MRGAGDIREDLVKLHSRASASGSASQEFLDLVSLTRELADLLRDARMRARSLEREVFEESAPEQQPAPGQELFAETTAQDHLK
jgi:hypothetical protein